MTTYDGKSLELRTFGPMKHMWGNRPETYDKWGGEGVLIGINDTGIIMWVDPVALANGGRTVTIDKASKERIAQTGFTEADKIPPRGAVTATLSSVEWAGLVDVMQFYQKIIPTFLSGRRTDGKLIWSIREGIMDLTLRGAAEYKKQADGEHRRVSKAECFMNGFGWAMRHMYLVFEPIASKEGAQPSETIFRNDVNCHDPEWCMSTKAMEYVFPWTRTIGSKTSKANGKSSISAEDRSLIFDCADFWCGVSCCDLRDLALRDEPKEFWTLALQADGSIEYRKFGSLAKAEDFVAKYNGTRYKQMQVRKVYSRSVLRA